MNTKKSKSLVTGSKFLLAASLVFFFIITGSTLSFAQEDTGSIKVSVKYNTGDRVDLYEAVLKVYQDNDDNPFVVVGFPETNPVLIDSLPLGHKYKVEVFVNGMLSGSGKLNVDGEENMEVLVPPTGGMVFVVLYNDEETPIEGAKLTITSDDGFQWRQDITDDDGKSKRFWLESNNLVDGHYVAQVSLDETVIYTDPSPVKFYPDLQKDIKIVTPWPKIVDKLITVSVYNGTQKVSKSDGAFVVELYDSKNNKVAQSPVNYRGDAFFSKLKVGQYMFQVLKMADDPDNKPAIWGITSAAITGKEDSVSIIKGTSKGLEKTCNCVAFRLDDIQDFFLNAPQTGVIKLFQGKNVPLTIGLIGGFIGLDPKIVDLINNDLKRSNPTLEIASHSWNNSPLTNYDKNGQLELLLKTDEKIFGVFGVSPSVFIPPENLLNNVTLNALEEIHYTHVTGHTETEIFPPTSLENHTVYYFPANSETAKLNADTNLWDPQSNENILARIQDGLTNYGYAVVMMHPYEFSVAELGIYTNQPNQQKLDEVSKLIDRVRNMGVRIVPIGQIEQHITDVEKQDMLVKSEDSQTEFQSCNCVAFRFVNIQDYWLDDVQIKVIDTFLQKGARITTGIIGNLFGNDAKLVNFIKNTLEKNDQSIEIANNGWDYEDFTSFTVEEQSSLIKQSNDHISSVLGKTPSVFIPPLEKFNDATISALRENNIKHISSSVKKDPGPYQLSGSEFYHFPGGPAVGKYNPIVGSIEGVTHEETLGEVQAYLNKYGFAVITLQPQEFSMVENNAYTNQVNQQQIQELELLIDKIQAQGLEIVPISKVNLDSIEISIPTWIKNNAGWWAANQIGDSDFVLGIQYLINEKIMKIPPAALDSGPEAATKIPDWIKNNAGWWADGQITDTDFVSGIQWLITNSIIKLR